MLPLSDEDQRLARSVIEKSDLLSEIAENANKGSRLEEAIVRHGKTTVFTPGEIIVREGEFGSHLHLLLSGTLLVLLSDPQEMATTPRREEDRRGGGMTIGQYAGNKLPASLAVGEVMEACKTRRLSGSPVIGETAVLTRSPYGKTVIAETDSLLLTMRWQGLRTLMNISPAFRQKIWKQCGKFAAGAMLPRQPFFTRLTKEAIAEIEDATTLETVGVQGGQTDVVREGGLMESLLFVQSGIGRIMHNIGDKKKSVGFVGHGDCYGLTELAAASAENRSAISHSSLQAEGEMSLLLVPAFLVEKHILPIMSGEEIRELDIGSAAQGGRGGQGASPEREGALVDFLVSRMLTNGREAMLIDRERCVECDECVRACARTHGGSPRFVRAGPVANGYAVANACMHCAEPLCLIDCPTGAIARHSNGEVIVSDELCIGCGTCVRACPYDNIRLVEIAGSGQEEGPTYKAHKCDLCAGRKNGPACVEACPHSALARINLTSHDVIPLLAEKTPLRNIRAAQQRK